MSKGKGSKSDAAANAPRITNRRALHEYFIEAKLECGIALVGSEVKSLRPARPRSPKPSPASSSGELILHQAHIDPYAPATRLQPRAHPRAQALAHRREIKKLESVLKQKGVTLVPLAMYFKDGRVKVEIGVARASSSTTSAMPSARRNRTARCAGSCRSGNDVHGWHWQALACQWLEREEVQFRQVTPRRHLLLALTLTTIIVLPRLPPLAIPQRILRRRLPPRPRPRIPPARPRPRPSRAQRPPAGPGPHRPSPVPPWRHHPR